MLTAIAVLLLLQATPVPTTGPFVTLDRIAAVVGDEVVLESEVRRLTAIGLLKRRPGEGDADYRDRVLYDRVDEVLLEQQLRRTAGLEPDPREVEARVAELAERVARERGETFEALLARSGVTREELTGWIRRGLSLDTWVRERLSPTVKVSEEEVRAYYEGAFRDESRRRGLAELAPLVEVQDELRALVRERKLNAEIDRFLAELRTKTRILVYRRSPA